MASRSIRRMLVATAMTLPLLFTGAVSAAAEETTSSPPLEFSNQVGPFEVDAQFECADTSTPTLNLNAQFVNHQVEGEVYYGSWPFFIFYETTDGPRTVGPVEVAPDGGTGTATLSGVNIDGRLWIAGGYEIIIDEYVDFESTYAALCLPPVVEEPVVEEPQPEQPTDPQPPVVEEPVEPLPGNGKEKDRGASGTAPGRTGEVPPTEVPVKNGHNRK